MTDEHADKMIRLLEEIRDGQRVQLERQAEALANQRDLVAQQRERLAGLSRRTTQDDDLLARSAKVVAGARVVAFVLVPFAIVFLGFLLWALFARVAG